MGKREKETAFIGLLLCTKQWTVRYTILYYTPTNLKRGYFPHFMDEEIEIQGITKIRQSTMNSEGISGCVWGLYRLVALVIWLFALKTNGYFFLDSLAFPALLLFLCLIGIYF